MKWRTLRARVGAWVAAAISIGLLSRSCKLAAGSRASAADALPNSWVQLSLPKPEAPLADNHGWLKLDRGAVERPAVAVPASGLPLVDATQTLRIRILGAVDAGDSVRYYFFEPRDGRRFELIRGEVDSQLQLWLMGNPPQPGDWLFHALSATYIPLLADGRLRDEISLDVPLSP